MQALKVTRPASINSITEEILRSECMPSLWGRKLVLAVLLTLWVSLPYYSLQRWVFFPVCVLEPGPIDRAIPFIEWSAWLYLSLYLLMPIAPIALATRREVGRFARDIALITLVSHLLFLFCPTRVPRPSGPTSDFAYRMVIGVDRPLNACPSLHASLAVYSALWCDRLLGKSRGVRFWRVGLWTWILVILYATLALRQHVLVDLLAGGGLAVAMFAIPGTAMTCFRAGRCQPSE